MVNIGQKLKKTFSRKTFFTGAPVTGRLTFLIFYCIFEIQQKSNYRFANLQNKLIFVLQIYKICLFTGFFTA